VGEVLRPRTPAPQGDSPNFFHIPRVPARRPQQHPASSTGCDLLSTGSPPDLWRRGRGEDPDGGDRIGRPVPPRNARRALVGGTTRALRKRSPEPCGRATLSTGTGDVPIDRRHPRTSATQSPGHRSPRRTSRRGAVQISVSDDPAPPGGRTWGMFYGPKAQSHKGFRHFVDTYFEFRRVVHSGNPGSPQQAAGCPQARPQGQGGRGCGRGGPRTSRSGSGQGEGPLQV
jgi:hypothetical protein